MKYFNRHTEMQPQTLRSIMDSINGVMLSEEKDTFELINMLYGLFDGFDYTEKILVDPIMKSLKKSNPDIHTKITETCEEIKGYPKFDNDVTEH